MSEPQVVVRRARTSDVRAIRALVKPLSERRVLLDKEAVTYYEAVQEFRVAETPDGVLIGCGALHVIWEDLGEIRTVAVSPCAVVTTVPGRCTSDWEYSRRCVRRHTCTPRRLRSTGSSSPSTTHAISSSEGRGHERRGDVSADHP